MSSPPDSPLDIAQMTGVRQLWECLLQQGEDRVFLEVPNPETSSFYTYRLGTFYRRAVRYGTGLMSRLGLAAGDRIAVIPCPADQFGFLLHGIWMMNGVVVSVPVGLDDDELIRFLNDADVKAVVFPLSMSARVAGLFSRVFPVKHWVVVGGSGATLGSGGQVVRLEEIVQDGDGELPPGSERKSADGGSDGVQDGDAPALIAVTSARSGRPKGVLFTQSQLLDAGRGLQEMMAVPGSGEVQPKRCYSHLPQGSFLSVVSHLIAPLFSDFSMVSLQGVTDREYWTQMRANEVRVGLLDYLFFRDVHKRGKSRSWLAPTDHRIIVASHAPLSGELIAAFHSRFHVSVQTTYQQTESGGFVTAFPQSLAGEQRDRFLHDFGVPSSGVPLQGVEVKVVDLEGRALDQEQNGEILVRSPQAMSGYVGVNAVEVHYGQHSYLHTGDEGFFVRDDLGQKHLFVLGRLRELIDRNSERISPAYIDTLLQEVKGVSYGITVGFPNRYTGQEVGVYVIPARVAGRLSEHDVIGPLREALSWSQCPKVVVFGDPGAPPPYGSRDEYVHFFEGYEGSDFSLGG